MAANKLLFEERMRLIKEFSGWQFLDIVLFLFYWTIFTTALNEVDRRIWRWAGPFTVIPGSVTWIVPAFFLTAVLYVIVNPIIFKRTLKDRYDGFIAYRAMTYGFRVSTSDAFDKGIVRVIPPIFVILTYFILCHHTTFAETGIEIRPLFSLHTQRYSYQDISAIQTSDSQTSPAGKVMKGRVYLLIFSDRSLWHSEFGLNGIDKETMRTIMTFVSRKSGKPIEEIDIFPRSESY
jgi:hypothetical protein